MWNVFKENKISSVLLLTVLLGALSTALELPKERATLWNGAQGHYLNYYVYFIFQYIITIVLVLSLLIEERTTVDKIMIVNYALWDVIGFLSYLYMGWPEPKELIIGFFGITSLIYIWAWRN